MYGIRQVSIFFIILLAGVLTVSSFPQPCPQESGSTDVDDGWIDDDPETPVPEQPAEPDQSEASGLNIEPMVPPCRERDGHLKLDARITPSSLLAEARLYFRAYGSTRDYYVPLMTREGVFSAHLPVPSNSTRQIVYWLRAFDHSGVDFRTSEFILDVNTVPTCDDDADPFVEYEMEEDLAFTPPRAIVMGLTSDDQNWIPAGFSGRGIVAYRTAAGVRKDIPVEAREDADRRGGWSKMNMGTKVAIIAGSAAVVMGAAMLLGQDDSSDKDDDGDGYTEKNGDCNDQNPDIHPGADEICDDGLDNDCDGLVDVEDVFDCSDWIDNDGDGYREVDGDCNDFDSTVNPGEPEVCDDNVDNDCDGFIDGSDPDCEGYEDFDGDGYPANVDCDDSDPAVHPGAREDCIDGIDNDCDGLTDDMDPDCSPALIYFILTQPPFDTDRDEILSLRVDGAFLGQSPTAGGDLITARVISRGRHTVQIELVSDPDADGSGFELQLNSPDPTVEEIIPNRITGNITQILPYEGEFLVN